MPPNRAAPDTAGIVAAVFCEITLLWLLLVLLLLAS